jgi:hypothetical protein
VSFFDASKDLARQQQKKTMSMANTHSDYSKIKVGDIVYLCGDSEGLAIVTKVDKENISLIWQVIPGIRTSSFPKVFTYNAHTSRRTLEEGTWKVYTVY